jgi:hypothetical protein
MAGNVRYLPSDGRYYARLVIPKDLRPFIDGKAKLRKPLGGDRRNAISKLPGAATALQHDIAIAERRAGTGRAGRQASVGRPCSWTLLNSPGTTTPAD